MVELRERSGGSIPSPPVTGWRAGKGPGRLSLDEAELSVPQVRGIKKTDLNLGRSLAQESRWRFSYIGIV